MTSSRCRLCFALEPGTLDIFEENNKSRNAAQIFKMFQIEMIDTPLLPKTCCKACSRFLCKIIMFQEKVLRTQISLTKSMELIAMGISEGPDIDSVCRLCGSENPGFANIFLDSAHGQKYSFHIQELLKIELPQSPILPQTCCSECLRHLEKIRTFRIGIIKSHASFINTTGTKEENIPTVSSSRTLRSTKTKPNEQCQVVWDAGVVAATEEVPAKLENTTEYQNPGLEEGTNSKLPKEENSSEDDFIDGNEGYVSDSIGSNDDKEEVKMAKPKSAKTTKQPTQRKKFKPLMSYDERLEHRKQEKHIENTMHDKGLLKCNECGVGETTFLGLVTHMKKEHGKVAGIVCCNKFQRGHTNSFDHMRYHMDRDAFKCTACGKQCQGRANLKQHMKFAHANRDHQCDMCGKTFVNDNLLDIHKRSHLPVDKRGYICSHCPKTFSTLSAVNRHDKRVHERSEAHKCTICGRGYPDGEYLQRHLDKHRTAEATGTPMPKERGPTLKTPKGERKLRQCNLCQKFYMNLYEHQLHAHKEIPKNQRSGRNEWAKGKMFCEKCGKYISKTGFKSHVNETCNAGVTNFKCETCGKEYTTRSAMKTHLYSHAPDRQRQCPFCPFVAIHEGFLIRHYHFKHPEEYDKLKEVGEGSGSQQL